ncbi:MAG TPA: ATP-binding protein [Thermoanaerobaculia bacterium]|nr:ATP-binding protein [Thermoanaerobaculia bacterium]
MDPATASEYDRVEFWISELERLDRVLEKPAISLIRLVDGALTNGILNDGELTRTTPTTIDEKAPRCDESLLVHAVACSAVQRLDNQRRRFSWLRTPEQDALERLRTKIPDSFVEHSALRSKVPLRRLDALAADTFGTLSPLPTSEVFWLLVRAGEKNAHGDLGFVALFGLLWALNRRTHGPFEAGAALGAWRPTSAVTARCLLPILTLNGILQRRAKLWADALNICETVAKNAPGRNQWQRWRFASELDHLSAVLHELEEISINPADFHKAADALTKLASPLRPQDPTADRGIEVRKIMRKLFARLGKENEGILRKAAEATNVVQKTLLEILKTNDDRRDKLARECNLVPDWELQSKAASGAHQICRRALRKLQEAVTLCDGLPTGAKFTHKKMIHTLERLSAINHGVYEILSEAIAENVEWCVRGVTREVAFASAKNDTDFDVAELLSGVVIAERTKRISRIEAGDAIRLCLRAAREDGSWWSGQPIFLIKRALGVWPSTPDVVLLLSTAVKAFNDIDCADEHLRKFIDWLEVRALTQHPEWSKRVSIEPLWGWSSEARESAIDVWTTATAVKALLEIREIIEDRLWSICENRFTVITNLRGLTEIDPVDLGARHKERLQTRLLRNAARARLHEKQADYSYMLHGPPGSSKSVLAQAIGKEMWCSDKGTVRFVRITPADFTRRGESGLDFEARFIFRLLSRVRGVTIFFDEIDDLLRVREVDAAPAFIRLVIPGMLNRLQDLRDSARAQEIAFLLGTNYIDQIEPALIRPGRIDVAIPVPYPDAWSREAILQKNAAGVSSDILRYVVENTAEWPWSTYQKLCANLASALSYKNARKLVAELGFEFQRPDYYYLNWKRWKATSPLETELVHLAFSISTKKAECRARVKALQDQLKNKDGVVSGLDLPGKFDTEWRREGRS